MSTDYTFRTVAWLQTIAINCLLLLLYTVGVYFVVSQNYPGRLGELMVVLGMGFVVALLFHLIANFVFFLHRKFSPEIMSGILLVLQGLAFLRSWQTMCFFWGATLINYAILAIFFRQSTKK
ncbi:hypothetical protein [Paraflavitalea pollutisoli]|uniref:hypothetical protein n=1 Tax=Paraflavitalea pollutisoli TaxID=3034143 RepID=UPI0023EAF0C5|nr:hypothetical protein [Paraflavitalea sp. H1-2-19X]